MLVLLAVPGLALAAEGSISGRVTHGGVEPGPVPEVLACELQSEEEEEAQGKNCALTAADGNYTIPNLPSGDFKIEFWPGYLLVNYVFEYYDNTRDWSQAQWIDVASGPVTGIDAELAESGFISGSVTRASDGEPLSEVLICAEEPLQDFVECSESGVVQGSYQLSGLLEGDYLVDFLPAEGQGVRSQFYKDKSESSEAEMVHVTTGAVTAPIDAALPAEATITGSVTDASTHGGLGEIEVCAFELTDPEITGCEFTEPSGSYVITDLPTGRYKVGFFSESVEEEEEEEEEEEKPLGVSPFPVQFWNDKPTWESADTLTLRLGLTPGINAALGFSPPAIPSPGAPQTSSLMPASLPRAEARRAHCRSGRRWKKVNGKKRCVKVHRRTHHKRGHQR